MPSSARSFSPSPEVSWKWANEEIVLLNLARSRYLVFEGAAGRMWELLCAGKSAAEIGSAILEEFETTDSVVERELDTFISELCADGWVVPNP